MFSTSVLKSHLLAGLLTLSLIHSMLSLTNLFIYAFLDHIITRSSYMSVHRANKNALKMSVIAIYFVGVQQRRHHHVVVVISAFLRIPPLLSRETLPAP